MSIRDININIKIDDNTKDLFFGVTFIIAVTVTVVVVAVLIL
jgi:hypothetical protein